MDRLLGRRLTLGPAAMFGSRGGLRATTLAVLSGGLLVLAFPRFDMALLAFVALAPWLASILDQRPRHAALGAFLAGLAFFVGSLSWIAGTMWRYAELPGPVALPGAIGVLLALSAYLSLYLAAFAAALAWLRPSSGPVFVLTAACLWVALEYLRSHLFSGFPWNLLGYSQYQTCALLPIARLTGVYGLSFLALAANAALGWAVRHWGRWGEAARAVAIPLALTGVVLVLSATERDSPGSGPAIPVALIQGNIAQELKWDPRRQGETSGSCAPRDCSPGRS